MRKAAILICLVAAACATAPPTGRSSAVAGAQQGRIGGNTLIGESVQGIYRHCTYAGGGVGAVPRVHRVGLGQRCPATFPSADPNFPAPPTARLLGSSVVDSRRACTYGQGSRRWTISIPLAASCPPNAGMAQR